MTQRWLFLLYLLILSHMIGAAIAGWALWRFSKPNGHSTLVRLMAGVMFGIFAFFAANLVASTFGHKVPPVHTTGYIVSYWTGHAILSASVWAFVLYIFGHRSSPPKE